MRPNHNNNKQRMRGRHRNNKPSNPLARSYESNGPDVKVRGNPQHIVEKYSQLARDAQVAGDPVLAEAYLQHAEHYYRIITAAHAAMAQAQGLTRPGENDGDESADDDDDMTGMQQPYPDFRQQQQMQQRADLGEQPQPEGGQPFIPRDRPPYQERSERQNFGDRQPYGERGERQDRGDRQSYGDRQERGERQSYGDRPDRGERQAYGDRGERQDRGDRQPYGDRQERGDRGDRGDRRFPPRGPRQDFRQRRPEPEAEGQETALPSFITGPAPRVVNGDSEPTQPNPPAASFAPEDAPSPAPAEQTESGEARAPFRARRRRRAVDAKAGADEAAERPEGQPVD